MGRRSLLNQLTDNARTSAHNPRVSLVGFRAVLVRGGGTGKIGRADGAHVLIGGERNPKVLAQLARGKARRKIRELEAAAGDPLADAEPAGDFGLGHLR